MVMREQHLGPRSTGRNSVRRQIAIIIIVMAALFLVAASRGRVIAGSDEEAIRQLLMDTFDKPEVRLVVDPIVVANDYAVADWSQDEQGGRALLRRHVQTWTVILCSGDAIKSASALQQAGVPNSDAAILAVKLEAAERTVTSERRRLFSTFERTILIGTEGPHGNAEGHPRSK